MEEQTSIYEDELIESLLESFSIAVEFMDSQTIINCIKVALSKEKEHYETMLNKYVAIENSIISQ